MNTESTLLHGMNPDDLKDMIFQEAKKIYSYSPDRFYNVIVTGEHFCLIHSISKITLKRWIKQGIVVPELRDDDKDHYRFRLSEVLKFDVESIKRKRNKQFLILNAHYQIKRGRNTTAG